MAKGKRRRTLLNPYRAAGPVIWRMMQRLHDEEVVKLANSRRFLFPRRSRRKWQGTVRLPARAADAFRTLFFVSVLCLFPSSFQIVRRLRHDSSPLSVPVERKNSAKESSALFLSSTGPLSLIGKEEIKRANALHFERATS